MQFLTRHESSFLCDTRWTEAGSLQEACHFLGLSSRAVPLEPIDID
jgi:hypothetical protein